eukprot:m.162282 g.162282  ORF g.162282 m.162282 type:complete len:60 (+) comp24877_c0_seq4:541-720(+)
MFGARSKATTQDLTLMTGAAGPTTTTMTTTTSGVTTTVTIERWTYLSAVCNVCLYGRVC